jgi:hypothetical protein
LHCLFTGSTIFFRPDIFVRKKMALRNVSWLDMVDPLGRVYDIIGIRD